MFAGGCGGSCGNCVEDEWCLLDGTCIEPTAGYIIGCPEPYAYNYNPNTAFTCQQ